MLGYFARAGISTFLRQISMAASEGTSSFLPLFVEGNVVKGFGRGSKQLGIPTANFTEEVVRELPTDLDSGVYFGFASIDGGAVDKMVLSVGWNPHFQNKTKTMETHILRQFDDDFYGSLLRVAVLGYLRPMTSFSSMDELIVAIKYDISRAAEELDKSQYRTFLSHEFFQRPAALPSEINGSTRSISQSLPPHSISVIPGVRSSKPENATTSASHSNGI